MSQVQTQIQSARRVTAAALTAIGFGLVVTVYLLFGPFLAAVVAIPIPVCLFFLWLSADVMRADEVRPAPVSVGPSAAAPEAARSRAPTEQHAH